MVQEKYYHRGLAAALFLISFGVYLDTIAPTTSFWDCGEFITCSFILGVPHPPGAPFFLLLGRIFSMLPLAADIGLRVNIISALTTALTVTLTYLIIARLIQLWRGQIKTIEDRIIVYGSSVVGAMAFAFSDSLWFNAVEAEVYAISMFFTAIIVWLVLIWHEKADSPASDRYILLIAYCIGLAIGIHLLNILALPAIFIIIFFRKYHTETSASFKFFAATSILFIIEILLYLKTRNIWIVTALPLIAVALIFVFRKNRPEYFRLFLFTGMSTLIFISIYPGVVKWIPNTVLFLRNHAGVAVTALLIVLLSLGLITALALAARYRNRLLQLTILSFLLILVGASTFSSVYIRSQLNPAIDENDPENLENLISYINREQYGDWSIIERRAPLWEYQIKKMYIRYLGWQFIGKGSTLGADGFLTDTINVSGLWGIPFLVGILGMVYHFSRDPRRAFSILLLFLFTGLMIVIYLNQTDPQPRERDYVFVASFFAFAIWIGVGAAGLFESISESMRTQRRFRHFALFAAALVFILLIPVRMVAVNYRSHNRSGDYVAYDYSYNLLQSCEKDAILFTNGDNDTFPLWFLQYVYNIRTDVRVVNLSLLNTNWYIKQLRDQEPRVPISMTDSQIDQLSPMYWPEPKTVKIHVPRAIYQRELEDLEQRKEFVSQALQNPNPPEMSFTLGPTLMGKGIRVQDIMILNIIASNQFEKPTYFAVTVSTNNMLNMHDYLRMDGLVYKLVTYPGEKISPSRLAENFYSKFQYRNLDDSDVYFNDNVLGLLINYRSGFLRLADFYRQEKMYPEMVAALDSMEKFIPESVIPLHDQRLAMAIGSMYLDGGRPGEFEKRLEYWLNMPGLPPENAVEIAQIYFEYLHNAEKSEQIALKLIESDPGYLRGYYWLFNLYLEIKSYAKGLSLAEKLVQLRPNDSQAKAQLQQFQKLNTSQDSSRVK
ncbi:MAG: protein O-mannosyl-transferase family [Candidatus Zhuqueibacterota bacterium]